MAQAGSSGGARTLGVVALTLAVVVALVIAVVAFDRYAREPGAVLAEGDTEVRPTGRHRLPDGFEPVDPPAAGWPIAADVYVPAYSTVYLGSGLLRSNLAMTLSVRNVSPRHAIVLRRVDYVDSSGNKVERLLARPHRLAPMSTADFFIDASDQRGGTGANFVVGWAADATVSEPLIEAVMIGDVGNRGFSFTSRGVRIDGSATGGD